MNIDWKESIMRAASWAMAIALMNAIEMESVLSVLIMSVITIFVVIKPED